MACWEEIKPIVAMVIANIAFAATDVLQKKALDEGMDKLVLITLRHLVATIFMAPVAYVKERKMKRKLTFEIIIYLFFSATLGAALMQYLLFMGLQYTTLTFSCAFLNVIPSLTFLIAVPLRLETANLRSKAGIAKVLGTAICFAGAVLLTTYKGTALFNNISQHSAESNHSTTNPTGGKWMIGTVALFACTVSSSGWYLLQPTVGKKYPTLYTGTTVVFFLSFLQTATLSLALQRNTSLWLLKKKLEIITVLVSGVAGSGLAYVILSSCVEKRGPVFTAAFNPLILTMVAVIDATILHEPLYLGSVLGSVLVVAGLYFLLWGKNKEARSDAVEQTRENARESKEADSGELKQGEGNDEENKDDSGSVKNNEGREEIDEPLPFV